MVSKTIILNLSKLELKGDILDVGESHGVIYSLTKEVDEEIAIDIVENDFHVKNIEEKYDILTLFFTLSQFWTDSSRHSLINRLKEYLKDKGQLYIWDINKNRGEVFNNKIRVLLPSERTKEFDFKNVNPFTKLNADDFTKYLDNNFKIIEEKVWEDLFFLKIEKL